MTLDQLRRQIERVGCCAVIEVTNGIAKQRILDNKIDEAHQGGSFVHALAPNETVYTGLMFFRKKRLERVRDPRLDFFCEIPTYDPNRAIKALREVKDKAKQYFSKTLVDKFIGLVENGTDLADLFYPDNWERFQDEFQK